MKVKKKKKKKDKKTGKCEECQKDKLNRGDHSQRCIRSGDKIRLKSTEEVHTVTEVTSDYGPHLPSGVILVLKNKGVRYLTADVVKVCKHCHVNVMEFEHGSDI